ncbi:hypothetical protein BDL97_01G025600 [Sphagnum fallax]|nr:hypothetical protein BDL97_01G025600 [Sphagnum fallax]KAH8973061.1 hypothetical protein BDL97_01G025600 [Sphagnum fallax]
MSMLEAISGCVVHVHSAAIALPRSPLAAVHIISTSKTTQQLLVQAYTAQLQQQSCWRFSHSRSCHLLLGTHHEQQRWRGRTHHTCRALPSYGQEEQDVTSVDSDISCCSVHHHQNRSRPYRIVISTGDVMGDIHGAALVQEILEEAGKKEIGVEVYAVGGHPMKAAGAKLIGDNTGLSSIGLLEALPLIIPSIQLQLSIRTFLDKHSPDIVVLLDYPGVNIPFGRYVKRQFGCKVVYYIPPNEWLWNTSQTQSIVNMSDCIFSVYPGEAQYFRKAGGHVVEVGHPLLDLVESKITRQEARILLRIREEDLVVLLMPASRPQELRHVWPVLASAARQLLDKIHQRANNLQVHFIVPSILLNQHHILKESFHKYGLTGCAKLWHGNSKMVMPAADLAITKSGSVNLELALFNVPQVVVYKIDAPTAWIARNIFKFSVRHISLVNLILEQQVVPEFIQENADASRVADAAFNMLAISNSGCRERVLEGYQELHGLLGMPGVAKRTAQLVLSSICTDN